MSRAAAIDAEIAAMLAARPALCASVTEAGIASLRRGAARMGADDATLAQGGAVRIARAEVAAEDGALLPMLVLAPAARPARGALLFLHGGGMVSGDERTGLAAAAHWAASLGLLVASLGYRLAPEHPHPVPVGDCHAGLAWLAEARGALGAADGPLIVAGASAGAGLAAATALIARDRGGPRIDAQMLMCPMLDDRPRWPSSTAFDGDVPWDAASNAAGWRALLGERAGGAAGDAYAAPARADALAGLPPTFIDVGSAETFRDEALDYAARLARAGVAVDCHMWAGAVHGFDVLAPDARVSAAAAAARTDFLARVLDGILAP